MCSARDPSPQQSASSDPSANRAGIIPRNHIDPRVFTHGVIGAATFRPRCMPPSLALCLFPGERSWINTLLSTSRSRLASGFYRDGRCNHAGRWAKASASKIAAGAGSAGNHSWGSFRCAASEASRFRAASASRSAPSRAMVRSAERRSFRLCFDDACLDDACFASVIFQRPFSYRFNGYTRGRFGRAIPNLPKRA